MRIARPFLLGNVRLDRSVFCMRGSFTVAFTVPSPNGDNTIFLGRADAATRLGISSRTLYKRTAPRGPIRSVRFGRRVLYPIAEIERYIADAMASQVEGGNGGVK